MPNSTVSKGSQCTSPYPHESSFSRQNNSMLGHQKQHILFQYYKSKLYRFTRYKLPQSVTMHSKSIPNTTTTTTSRSETSSLAPTDSTLSFTKPEPNRFSSFGSNYSGTSGSESSSGGSFKSRLSSFFGGSRKGSKTRLPVRSEEEVMREREVRAEATAAYFVCR